MKSLFTLLAIFTISFCNAQAPPINFKFAPFALIDEGTFPTISGGVEFPISERMTIYGELGIRYRKGSYDNSDTSFVSSKGYKVKTEVRYYLNAPITSFKFNYLAANIFFGNSRHNDLIPYYPLRDSSETFWDNFSSKKNVLGLNVLAGAQTKLSKRILADAYVGIGIRFRFVNTQHLEFDSARDGFATSRHPNIDDTRARIQSGNEHLVAPNFTFGVRFCWRRKP